MELYFDDVFDIIVNPLVDQVYNGVDKSFCDEISLKIKDLLEVKKSCKSSYINKENELKQLFYGKEYIEKRNSGLSGDFRFDLHKVAAILCYTLIRNKVFLFDVNKAYDYIITGEKKYQTTSWIVNNVLINYKLAFHASINMIYQKSLYDTSCNDDKKRIELLTNKNGLFLYEERNGHESFTNSIIYDFAKRDIRNRSFDCLMYSAMLFQIEEYNKLYFKTCEK